MVFRSLREERREGGDKGCTALKSSREGERSKQWLSISNVGTLGARKGTGSVWWYVEA